MTESERVAARRRLQRYGLGDTDVYRSSLEPHETDLDRVERDRRIVVAFDLADNPADDAEPVTEKWLRAAGFTRPMAPAADRVMVAGEWRDGFYPITLSLAHRVGVVCDWVVWVGGYNSKINGATRGHVRRLCAALGIKLKP